MNKEIVVKIMLPDQKYTIGKQNWIDALENILNLVNREDIETIKRIRRY